jgi:hypothetical protein
MSAANRSSQGAVSSSGEKFKPHRSTAYNPKAARDNRSNEAVRFMITAV